MRFAYTDICSIGRGLNESVSLGKLPKILPALFNHVLALIRWRWGSISAGISGKVTETNASSGKV